MEALLPWKNLGLQPKLGMTFGMQVATIGADKPGIFSRMIWYLHGSTAFDSTAMHTLRLAKAPSAPVKVVISGDYCDLASVIDSFA